MLIVWLLALGWLGLLLFHLKKGYKPGELIRYSASGIYNARVVLLTLALIGILTALWRSSGTIAYIVTYSIRMVRPGILLLCIFLLNALVSFLIGTSFGTSATMGVICMILANASGLSPFLSGGAIMSGIFFGDRCSPISSSAMLVASVTDTDLYDNIRNMFRTARLPFLATCLLYLLVGLVAGKSSDGVAQLPDFTAEFHLNAALLLPAVIVLILAIFRVNVRVSVLISCLTAILVCLLVQKQSMLFIGRTMLWGFEPEHRELASLISGGGLFGMKKVLGIVGLSSTYSGIIKNTDLAEILIALAARLHRYLNRMGCMILVSILTSMIGCNQTLAIMLTNQFCESLYEPGEKALLANHLEDTVVVLSPLIPWCIAGAVPIATVGAPVSCLFAASYLYLLPLWSYLRYKD